MLTPQQFVGDGLVALDTETTGLVYPHDAAFSVALAGRQSVYLDLRHDSRNRQWIQEVLDRAKRIVCHWASFDVKMLVSAGFRVPLEKMDCTIVRACLINEHEGTLFPWLRQQPGGYELDALGRKYVNLGKLGIDIENIESLPVEEARTYAIRDVEITLKLWHWQEQEIREQGLENIVEFERRIMPTLLRTELRGVRVDVRQAEIAMRQLTPLISERQKRLDKIVGWKVNVNSSPQVKKIFTPEEFDGEWYVNGVRIGRTDKGAPSLKAEYLRALAEVDERAALVESIRSLIKTRDTFLGKHIIEHSVQGRVYPTINQSANNEGGTRTGRLSYTDPALQQIPSRDKDAARIVKACFLPEEGQVWSSNDMHSFEVRIFVALANVYAKGLAKKIYGKNPANDLHQYVADLTGLPRNAGKSGAPNAKQLNLSMIFTQGAGATAHKMGMKCEDAEFEDDYGKKIRYKKAPDAIWPVLDKYHNALPGVRTLKEKSEDLARSRGAVRTPYGRKLRFPKKYKSYKASGLKIQATSADLNKENWLLIEQALGDRGTIILNTHDSYDLSIETKHKAAAQRDVKAAVERVFMEVPLLLDHNGYGKDWWDAIKD